MPVITAIVPTFNDQNFIERCLCSVIAQAVDDVQIIVVDRGSSDQTQAITQLYKNEVDQVIDAQPDRVEAYWERAMLDMEEGFLEDAVQGFDLCISADEMYVNGRFFKARCLEAMGKADQALTEYKSYLPLSPDTAVSKSVEGIIERLESDLSGLGT